LTEGQKPEIFIIMASSSKLASSDFSDETPPQPSRHRGKVLSFSRLRWQKAWRDLWLHKFRSILVILSIAIGIFAFGMILGARSTITKELPIQYMSVVPASATLHTSLITDAVVESIQRLPDIAVATGRQSTIVRFLDKEGRWENLQLFALEDYDNSGVNIIKPYLGAWPPGDKEILIERNSLYLTESALNEELVLETSTGQQRALKLSGLVHDMNQLPAQVTGIPYGYVNRNTLEWLGLSRNFNELQILVAEDRLNKAHITQVAEEVRDKIEKAGAYVSWTEVPEPGKHLVEEFLPTIILLLSTLGLLALVLSAFLVINVITAVMTQQQKQIGIMKSIGAKAAQIISVYLRMVLLLGIAALVLAIPLSALGAYEFSHFMAGQLNFDLYKLRPSDSVLALEIIAGILIPVLAALYPVRQGTKVTVREAIQDYGLQMESNRQTPIDKILVRIPVSRPLRISLRNTFRRKGRLMRTLITLMLGGAIFMSVISVRASLFNTLEQTLTSQGFDVQVQLDQPYRRARIEQEVRQVRGIKAVETWRLQQGIMVRNDETDADDVIVYALPPDTVLYKYNLTAGSWLQPEDEAVIIVPSNLIRDYKEVELGEEMTLRIAGNEDKWRVTGVVEAFQPPIAPPTVYVSRPYLEKVIGDYGREDLVRVLVDDAAGYSDIQVRQALENRFKAAGMEIRTTHTISEDRDIFGERFNIITVILLIMAFLMAVVGALGLMGTMSINVLERKREIGVMRAIGASDSAVLRIFVVEGIIIGLLSWLGGIVISQPMSRLISRQIGTAFLERPLDFQYNWFGPFYWLIIILIISAVASLLPAYNAARLSVRETIAYE
jgi:putative ABC transport system permease protein